MEKRSNTASENGKGLLKRTSLLFARLDRSVYTHRSAVLLMCLAVMVIMTAVKYALYPPNAFGDASFILERAKTLDLSGMDNSYALVTRIVHGLISVTGITTMEQWSRVLLVPGAAMAIIILYLARPQSVGALFTALCFSALMPFYIFMTGKDFLQFTAFFLMAVLLFRLPKQWQKALAAMLVLIPVAILFRSYYVLMIALIAVFYVFALVYRQMLTASSRAVCLMGTMLLVVLAFYAVRIAFPDKAQMLFTVRTQTNANLNRDAFSDKVILDLLPLERSVPGFLFNYLTAALRMALPLELLKDPGDIPFVLFQTVLTVLFVVELIRSRRVQARTAIFAVALAFFFMSFFFEPDFGSWFRHETAAFPILWLALGADAKTMRGVNTGA